MSNTKHFWGRGEVRLNDDQTVDEVVTGQLSGVHLEQMDDGIWWMGLYGRDGRRMVVQFVREGKSITVNVADDGDHNSGISEGFKCREAKTMRTKLQSILRFLSLFTSVVWRRWEQPRPGWPAEYACTYRLSVSDAFRISWNIHFRKGAASPSRA